MKPFVWLGPLFPVVIALCAVPVRADRLVTWPAAEGTAATDGEYRVTVDGRPVDVIYIPPPSMHDDQLTGEENLQPYYAAFFDADKEVAVVVESPNDLTATRILPTSRGVKPSAVSAHRVAFRAKPPFKLSFEPRPRHRALVFSANVPEVDAPSPNAPGVKYFAPGRHHFDEPIRVGSGETLYLAPGAWVEAAVVAEGTNVTVRGRGVLSGLCWEHFRGPLSYHVQLKGENVQLRDLTIIGAWQWCVAFDRCRQGVVEGVNILNGHVLNDDGIDSFRSRDITIRNVFVRTQDDCICAKWTLENFTVENAILWTDVANIFRIGYECDGRPHPFRHFRVRGVDVLHQSIQKPTEWRENAIYIQASNGMTFEDMVFEDFRFDGSEPGDNLIHVRTQQTRDQYQQHESPGQVRKVTFRNFSFPGGLPKGSQRITVESIDDAHTVEGVRFEGFNSRIEFVTKGKVKVSRSN